MDETNEYYRQEQIQRLPLSKLVPFTDHPFRVQDDDRMTETVESVKEYGVLVPIIVRPMADGTYEIVSGHRRKRTCELAGVEDIPAIIRDLDDDEGTIIMVDSNLQRENILPSERAKAYQMKLDAIRHQGERRDFEFFENLGKHRKSVSFSRKITEAKKRGSARLSSAWYTPKNSANPGNS